MQCRFVNAYFGYGLKFNNKSFSPLLPSNIESEFESMNSEAQDVTVDPTPIPEPEAQEDGENNAEEEGGEEEQDS